jgi:hypothetical protein
MARHEYDLLEVDGKDQVPKIWSKVKIEGQ